MNRSVEQALTSLISRHNGPLPPELVELASSLLAQSRTKASNLKAEEEIGRTYACANIACERFITLLYDEL
jgi:origin recognition complex subunit 6